MLRRWNDKKEIDSWEFGTDSYRRLSIEDKEALLIDIAARKFENPKNFILFEQDELVDQIAHKLQLANTQEGIAVLKAIEAQHGLLIERADELWSFSHLTFQEYFTVQWLTQLPSQQLAKKIASKLWQEVVEQLVKSQQPADRLLRLIKQAIDQSIASDPGVQHFLKWLVKKSESVTTPYKRAAIRAFYYGLARARDFDLARARALDCDLDLTCARDCDFDLALDLARALARAVTLARAPALARDLALALALDLDLSHARDRAFALDLAFALVLDLALARDRARAFDLDLTVDLDLDIARDIAYAFHCVFETTSVGDPELKLRIQCQSLQARLPSLDDKVKVLNWWRLQGKDWIAELRKVMIEYRNIGHDWQFTEEQKQQLQRYYDANEFLVGLMQVEGAVTEECRAEIEDGLLLPWVELQQR